MKLIKELAENNDFQFLLGLDKPDKRMRDRGLVLEFLAFYHNTYLNYKSPMKQFLNRELELNRDLNQALEKDYRQVFKQAVDITKTVFGDRAFRRFVAGDEEDPNGQWELKKINKALFDIIMFGFTKYPKSQIIPKADIIREELIFLMSKDIKFIESITLSTGNLERVNARFKKWLESLEEIVGLPSREQRNFTLEFKKQLFEQNPTCSICGQKIHTLDDSEIDHIEQYWRGGKTIPSNARLVHRYCNRRRGGRD